MTEKENDKYSSPIINNAKNEKFREKFTTSYFLKLKIKKLKIFKKQSKHVKMIKTENLIIH